MADHMLCCDERWYFEQTGLCRIVVMDGENSVADGVTYEKGDFVLLTKGNGFSLAVKHCPWCGVELDAGAEGVEDDDSDSEETPINSAHAPTPPARLEIGSLVVALEDIEDTDPEGKRYLHAQAGDVGMVCAYHDPSDPDSWPTIAWSGRMAFDYWARQGSIPSEVARNYQQTSGCGVYDCEVWGTIVPLRSGATLQRDGSRK